jgi:Protein of unknown function (DUF4079)
VEKALRPLADTVKGQDLPAWLVQWGHPGNMAVVLLAMGLYGSAYLGWQIRTRSGGASAVAYARKMHPKIAIGMTVFFTLGALGGVTSLMVQGRPPFQSAHVWTGVIGLLLLYLQGMLPLFFEDEPNARSAHAYLGSSVMVLFVVHMALGLQLGFSL